MDIVIPLGKSKWQNREIRYTLRSFLKHSIEPIGKIYLIGEKPEFFEYKDKVVHIPFKQNQVKEINIWEKVLRACVDEGVSDEFFFANDDYFFMNDFVMSTFPNYHKGDILTYPYAKGSFHGIKNPYHQMARRTMDVLRRRKLTTWFYDIHFPMRFEKEKFLATYATFHDQLYRGNGLIMKTCYGNYNNLEPTLEYDVKFLKSDLYKLLVNYKDYLMISTSDDICCPRLLDFFEQIYPTKAPFEL